MRQRPMFAISGEKKIFFWVWFWFALATHDNFFFKKALIQKTVDLMKKNKDYRKQPKIVYAKNVLKNSE